MYEELGTRFIPFITTKTGTDRPKFPPGCLVIKQWIRSLHHQKKRSIIFFSNTGLLSVFLAGRYLGRHVWNGFICLKSGTTGELLY